MYRVLLISLLSFLFSFNYSNNEKIVKNLKIKSASLFENGNFNKIVTNEILYDNSLKIGDSLSFTKDSSNSLMKINKIHLKIDLNVIKNKAFLNKYKSGLNSENIHFEK